MTDVLNKEQLEKEQAVAVTELHRAERARRIMEDELFVTAVDEMRAELVSGWKASGAKETELREQIWLTHKMLEKLLSKLNAHMRTGEMAQSTLERVRKQIAWFRDR